MEETGCEIICGAPTTLAVKEDMMMIAPFGFLPWEIRIAFPEESQLRQSRTTQPTVHAGFFFFLVFP